MTPDDRRRAYEATDKAMRQYGFDPGEVTFINVLVYEFLHEQIVKELGLEDNERRPPLSA